jgi:hypothetical protein
MNSPKLSTDYSDSAFRDHIVPSSKDAQRCSEMLFGTRACFDMTFKDFRQERSM